MAAYGAVEGSGRAERGGEAAVTGGGAALGCPAAAWWRRGEGILCWGHRARPRGEPRWQEHSLAMVMLVT